MRAVWLLGGLLLAALVRADDGRAHARRAAARLGPELWSQVWRWERTAPDGARTPRHALVFELSGRLWLYEPGIGTQSLSHRAGRLAEDRADPRPLLAAIDPAAADAVALPDGDVPATGGRLPQGCFVESVARWREWCRRDRAPEAARLLAFYTPAGVGHAVLVYTRHGRTWVFDPDRPGEPQAVPDHLAADCAAIARRLLPAGLSAEGLWTRRLPLATEPPRELALASRAPPVHGAAGEDAAFH